MASPLDLKKDDQNVWVENLKTGDSVYRSARTNDPYPMTPNGVVGSVISVPVKVAKEAYFRRAISRGALKLLTDDEAFAREEDLVLAEDEAGKEVERTMEALEKGASESGSRYKNKNLSDDGSEGKSVTAREVWENRKPAEAPGTVRQSKAATASDRAAKDITAPAIASDEVPDGPIEAVITAPVKEGEWQSDTGL
jgi:hypothetical protein